MNLRILAGISTLVASCFVSTMASAQTPAALSCIDDFENGLDASQWTTISDGSVQIHPNWTDVYAGNAALTYVYTYDSVATTRPINTLGGARISFAIDIRQFVRGPMVIFEYSVDNGQSWTTIRSFDYNGTWVNPWTTVDMDAPAGAASAATLFRWRQADSSGGQIGAWSLDRVRITTPGNTGPSIVLSPHDRVTYPGSIVTLQSYALGTGLLSYQWRKDSVPISGASDPNLIIYNAQTNQAGAYSVVVSNQFWAVTSSVAQVSFTSFAFRPRVLASTDSTYGQDLFAGQSSLIDSGAFAQVEPLNEGVIPTADQLADYDVVVATKLGNDDWDPDTGDALADYVDTGGGVVESLFAYSVGYGPLLNFGRLSSGGYLPLSMARAADMPGTPMTMIANQPTHPILNGVGTVTSDGGNWGPGTVTTSGSQLITHWSSGVPMVATKTTHAGRVTGLNGWFSGMPLGMVGNMILWTSRTPAPEPNIVKQPSGAVVTPGTLTKFTAYVAGATPMGFQWMRNGAVIGGALDSSYVIANPQMGDDATYSFVATNAFGSVTSGTAGLAVEVAPQIVEQPQAATVAGGGTATLSVSATGTPLAYQWYKGGSALPDQTQATLSIANAGLFDDGNYSVVIRNDVGTVTSASAHVTVFGPPEFLSQPVSQTTTVGGSATLSCNVYSGGTLPPVTSGDLRVWLDASADVITDADGFVYGWQDSSPNHFNATQNDPRQQPLLVHPPELNGRRAVHFANYGVGVSMLYGNGPIGIQNASTVFVVYSNEGRPAWRGHNLFWSGGDLALYLQNGQMTYDAFGTGVASTLTPPTNSWRVATARCNTNVTRVDMFDADAVSSTNVSVAIPNAGPYPHNDYGVGFFTGNIAEEIIYKGALSDQDRASIETYLKQKYFAGANTPGTSYQWQLNGVDIAGATNASLQLSSVGAAQGGTYSVVIANVNGSTTSSGAVLTVNGPGAPHITSGPQNQGVHFGDTVSVSVTATGDAPLHYQWSKDGNVLSGATGSQFTINDFGNGDAGNYTVSVSNDAGATVSSPATIGVAPSIVVQPHSTGVLIGQPFQLSVQAAGAPLSYQWRQQYWDAPLLRGTSATYGMSQCNNQDAGNYFVVVSNAFGCVTSAVVNVTIETQPVVWEQPSSQTVRVGDSAEFDSFSSGGPPQWYHNGVPVPGDQWSWLPFNNIQMTDAGTYYLVVSNLAGTATSKKATLTVLPAPPRITMTSPANGATVTSMSVPLYGTCNPTNMWEIDISVNDGPRQQVVQGEVSSWDAGQVELNIGTNKIVATVIWYFDGYEYSVTNTVICAPALTLHGGIVGPGTVSPNLFGQTLACGKTYHMTAVPAANSVFVGWSSTNSAAIISTNPALTFVMTTSTYLRAIFEPDPFLPLLGSFNGLFSDTNVATQSAGYVTVKVAKKGVYSGSIKRAGASFGISGKFDLHGHANTTIKALGLPVDMQLDFQQAKVTGTINGGPWNSSLRALRAPYTGVNHSPWAGKYTMVLPANAAIGSGNGFSIINQMPNGMVNMTPPSTLADGVATSQSVGVCANGEWPVYVSLNGGTGILFGWLNFSNAPSATVGGKLTWLRSAAVVGEVNVNASSYTPGAANFGLNVSTLTASCEGGALKNCVSNVVSLAKNPVAVQSPNTNSLAITVTPANGYFSGKFVYGGVLKKIKGVLLQKQTNGAGLFLDSPQNGAVSLK